VISFGGDFVRAGVRSRRPAARDDTPTRSRLRPVDGRATAPSGPTRAFRAALVRPYYGFLVAQVESESQGDFARGKLRARDPPSRP
jgi:hypothetical protein